MARQPIGSREYKVMLRAERFAGDEARARRAVDEFWADVRAVLDEVDIPAQGRFDEVKAHRRIRFLDTAEGSLNGRRYIFRERLDVETDERELTLKFRHPDRYFAQDHDLDPKGHRAVKTKFEEDVKPPFVSVYSYSTTVVVDNDRTFDRLRELVALFPGLEEELEDLDGDGDLSVVRGFCARELVLVGAAVLLGRRDVEAECAMVVWHDDDDVTTPPVCVEFSFKYGDDEEDYRGSVTRDAYDVLQLLGDRLSDWVDAEPMTKTAFVYQ